MTCTLQAEYTESSLEPSALSHAAWAARDRAGMPCRWMRGPCMHYAQRLFVLHVSRPARSLPLFLSACAPPHREPHSPVNFMVNPTHHMRHLRSIVALSALVAAAALPRRCAARCAAAALPRRCPARCGAAPRHCAARCWTALCCASSSSSCGFCVAELHLVVVELRLRRRAVSTAPVRFCV